MKTFIITNQHETLIGGIIPTTYYADTYVEANDEDEARAKFLAEWKPEKDAAGNNFYGAALGVPQDIPTQSKGVEILSIKEEN
tara:strand:+ start:103 stop:351 length:249 start_codon:yes stop_codon:yes gene_type:complete